MPYISPELLIIVLGLSGIEIESVSIDSQNDLIIRVKSISEGTRCHRCGCHISKPCHPGKEIKLRHLAVSGYRTYIVITPLRYQCTHCHGNPTTTQKFDWYEQRHSCTKAFERHILLSLINSTVKDVSIREDIGYDTVMGIIDNNISPQINWEEIKALGVIGIDEVSIKKGHKDFVTVISAYIDGKLTVLAVLKGREKSTVKAFFLSIPKRLRRTVKAICSDLYQGFINAAKEVFGKKIPVIADRFHVAKLYRNGLEKLRKKEMKRLKEELPEKEYKKLKNVMWLLRKPFHECSQEEQKVLHLLFHYSPDLRLAYDFCFDLTWILNQQITPGAGKRKIKGWIRRVRNSGLTCFNSVLKTIETWMIEITNYFIGRDSSGFVEGLNNKIKVIKRRCYGVTNITHLFQRIYLDLVGYSKYKNINKLQISVST